MTETPPATPVDRERASDRGATKLTVCFVARAEPGTTGTSRYVASLAPHLERSGCEIALLDPRPSGRPARALAAIRRLGLDLGAFLASYPLRLRWPAADVYHLTGQTYASVLVLSPPPGPVVVTVHDIIPHLVRDDARLNQYRHLPHRLIDGLALRALRRADALIADSQWTRQTVIEHGGVSASRVRVVPLGVDGERYRPLDVPDGFRQRTGLASGRRYVLYVGSEDPRKNLPSLWRAFARVRAAHPDARLVKAGRGHFPQERDALVRLAEELGIGDDVIFLNDVVERDLPLLYNAASVYVQPSQYEGFGLPVLEALACGTAVVCAGTSALTEVAGADAIVRAPTADGLADGLDEALRAPPSTAETREARRAWATSFSWPRTAAATAATYRWVVEAGRPAALEGAQR